MKNIQRKPIILVIDDEASILEMLKGVLEDEGMSVVTQENPKDIEELIFKHTPDAVLLDVFMPGHNGIDALTNIKKSNPDQQVIIMSGYGTINLALDAIRAGARDFIEKPISLDNLCHKLAFTKQTTPTPDGSIEQALGIVGASSLFDELVLQLKNLSTVPAPILIQGPRGCGKKLYASYIHKIRDKNLSILTLNAQSARVIPSNQAVTLTDIDDADSESQAYITSWLKTNPQQSIVVTTKKPLFQLMNAGMLAPELYQLLSSAPLEIPALKFRAYDIALLAHHFLLRANKIFGKKLQLTPAVLRILKQHEWPGDVGQLEEIIYMITECTQHSRGTLDQELVSQLTTHTSSPISELETATNMFQKAYLKGLLKTHNHDLQSLAHDLHIPFSELYDKMVKLQIL